MADNDNDMKRQEAIATAGADGATAKNEIVVYQPNDVMRLEVMIKHDTVWLNRKQLAQLFGRDIKTIGKHIANALQEELAPVGANFATTESEAVNPTVAKFATVHIRNEDRVVAKFATSAADGKTYQVEYYNLEMITSIGYRVKSPEGVMFRRWANHVLKEYLLRGYVVNSRINQLEDKMDRRFAKHDVDIAELREKVDFFVRTSEPPVQGVFYDGQLWDACSLVEKLVGRAKRSILLIDNWVGAGTLDMLAKKRKGVAVTIVTSEHKDRRSNPRLTLAPTDMAKFNAQYPTLNVRYNETFHDRFLILDDKELYLIGASLKDLGKKCFAFTRLDASEIAGLKARIK